MPDDESPDRPRDWPSSHGAGRDEAIVDDGDRPALLPVPPNPPTSTWTLTLAFFGAWRAPMIFVIRAACRLSKLQRLRIRPAANAAAAADRLRQNAVRTWAEGRDPAGLVDKDVAREISASAKSADRHRHVHRPAAGLRIAGRDEAGEGAAAVAAAAAERLRLDAVGLRAEGDDFPVARHVCVARQPAAPAKSSQGQADIDVRVLAGRSDRAAEREAAVATGAADRLGENAVRSVASHDRDRHERRQARERRRNELLVLHRDGAGGDRAGVVDGHVPALAPVPPKPPTDAEICFASGPPIEPAMLSPPLPPPPPIDSARMPME